MFKLISEWIKNLLKSPEVKAAEAAAIAAAEVAGKKALKDAEAYARKQADLNKDGKLDVADALLAVKAADVNKDGKVDSEDAVAAVKTVAKRAYKKKK